MTTLAEAPALPLPASAVDADNPWPGLESFHERDAIYFRGRAAESDALVRLVLRERVSVLFGLSGLGKSSLLQAGLYPRLREQLHLPVHIRLAHDDDDAPPLRRQVLDALAAEAAAHGVEAPAPAEGDTLWEYFHRKGHGCWNDENRPVVPLLVFDQFEEAFTLGRESQPRQLRTAGFLDELGDLLEGRPPADLKALLNTGRADPRDYVFNRHPYRVLLGIREDFLADLETLAARMPSLMTNRMRLTALRGDAALLVTGAGGESLVPSALVGGGPGIGERIVRLVAGDPGEDDALPLASITVEPALLSLFCRELNERRKALGQSSITADLVEGSREQILSAYYARCTDDLGPAARVLVEEHLLTVGGHRNSEALENALALPGITGDAVDALIARRLVRREDRDRSSRLELTHDVLTGVVRQARDRRRAEEDATSQAEQARLEAEERAEELARENARRERELQLARRTLRIAAIAAVVCLALAVYAVVSGRSAVAAKQDAVASKDSMHAQAVLARTEAANARAATARADSLRKEADRSAAAAIQKKDSLDRALGMLEDTTDAMRAARQQRLSAERQSTLEQEVSQHYLSISGQLNAHRLAEDEAVRIAFEQRLDTLRNESERLRQESAARTDQHEQQIRALVTAICMEGVREGGKPAAGAQRNTALFDSIRVRAVQRFHGGPELEKEMTCASPDDAATRAAARP